MAETGSMVGNLSDGVRGFFHSQSLKEAQFHKVQPAPKRLWWLTQQNENGQPDLQLGFATQSGIQLKGLSRLARLRHDDIPRL